MQALYLRRQERHGLPRGVSSTDQRYLLSFAQLCLHWRSPVGDTSALEDREVRDRRPAVPGAGGDDNSSRARPAAVGEL